MERKRKRDEKDLDKLLLDADKEVERRNKQVWTKETIQAHGENFQKILHKACNDYVTSPSRKLQPWQVRRNQRVALDKLNAKRQEKRVVSHSQRTSIQQQVRSYCGAPSSWPRNSFFTRVGVGVGMEASTLMPSPHPPYVWATHTNLLNGSHPMGHKVVMDKVARLWGGGGMC